MNLGNFLAQIKKDKNSPQKKKTLFALRIDSENVQACLWLVENEETHVLAVGKQEAWQSEEELLPALDTALSSIDPLTGSAQDVLLEPDEVILGLPFSWIEDDKIIIPKLKLLKKIFRDLDLKPIGFVAIPEAISHFFKAEEGMPFSGILVELKLKKLCLTLVSLGKIKAYEEVIRSRALEEDLLEGLFRLKEENNFPARVLIFGSEEVQLEDVRQKLIDYPWAESGINFLHLPKIDLLPLELPVKAVALAGGRETAGAKNLSLSTEAEIDNEKTVVEETNIAADSDNLMTPPVDSKPILQHGFIDDDIGKTSSVDQVEPLPSKPLGRQFDLKKYFGFFSKISLPGANLFAPKLLLALFLLLIIFAAAVAGLWFFPKAVVTLRLEPKNSQTDFLVQIDGSAEDNEVLQLPGQSVSTELVDSKSQPTSGTALVGEKAAGKVEIFNRTSQDKTFAQGTVLAGPDGLEFTLDEEVTVASQSAGQDYSLLPGKASAQVTAVEIGADSNLAAKAEFSLANFARSDFIARNEEAFAGGSSREVQAVAQQDLDDLEESLTEELTSKAVSELQSQIVDQKELIADSVSLKVLDRQFDHQAGDQAEEISLKLTIAFSGLVFSRQELKDLANSQLKESVSPDYIRLEDEDQFTFELKDPDELIFQVSLKTTLVPKLDLVQIKKDLAGKKVALAQSYLLSLSGVKGVDMAFSPRLPSWLLTLPRVSQNITIETKIE